MAKCGEADKLQVARVLYSCFCLCHDVRVVAPRVSKQAIGGAKLSYDGASQDELLLIKLA